MVFATNTFLGANLLFSITYAERIKIETFDFLTLPRQIDTGPVKSHLQLPK